MADIAVELPEQGSPSAKTETRASPVFSSVITVRVSTFGFSLKVSATILSLMPDQVMLSSDAFSVQIQVSSLCCLK